MNEEKKREIVSLAVVFAYAVIVIVLVLKTTRIGEAIKFWGLAKPTIEQNPKLLGFIKSVITFVGLFAVNFVGSYHSTDNLLRSRGIFRRLAFATPVILAIFLLPSFGTEIGVIIGVSLAISNRNAFPVGDIPDSKILIVLGTYTVFAIISVPILFGKHFDLSNTNSLVYYFAVSPIIMAIVSVLYIITNRILNEEELATTLFQTTLALYIFGLVVTAIYPLSTSAYETVSKYDFSLLWLVYPAIVLLSGVAYSLVSLCVFKR